MTALNLLVGGPEAEWPANLADVPGDWIGVDRGTLRLIKMGIEPKYAIGDFDSMSADELALVKRHVANIHSSRAEKDDTDTQLGVKAALGLFNATRVNIYGATGGRLDHFLANFLMVLEPRFTQFANRIHLYDRQNSISYFLPGSHEIEREADKRYLAFVPMNAMELTLSDERYQLHGYPIARPVSLASNEFVGDYAHFEFDTGVLAVIQSKDK